MAKQLAGLPNAACTAAQHAARHLLSWCAPHACAIRTKRPDPLLPRAHTSRPHQTVAAHTGVKSEKLL
eukprot:1916996-Prymnesium_polylepis.3